MTATLGMKREHNDEDEEDTAPAAKKAATDAPAADASTPDISADAKTKYINAAVAAALAKATTPAAAPAAAVVVGAGDGELKEAKEEKPKEEKIKSCLRLVIPAGKAGYMIGPKGSIVKELRAASSCGIHVQDNVGATPDSRVCVITSSDTPSSGKFGAVKGLLKCYLRASEVPTLAVGQGGYCSPRHVIQRSVKPRRLH
jgi:hypothetical protein